jgi:hypothetical protein
MGAFAKTFFSEKPAGPGLVGDATVSFKPDLRISTVWAIALLGAAGTALGLAAQLQESLAQQERMQDLALLTFLLTLLVWLLQRWQPGLARWGVVLAWIGMIYGGLRWLQLPDFLTLLVIPTTLAAALLGLPAALLIAVGETMLLLTSKCC